MCVLGALRVELSMLTGSSMDLEGWASSVLTTMDEVQMLPTATGGAALSNEDPLGELDPAVSL